MYNFNIWKTNIDIFSLKCSHKNSSNFLYFFSYLRAQCIALQWDAVSSFFILSIFVFQVEVMVPPAVQAMPRQGRIETRKGKDITLRCSGKGNPNPRITWSKKVYYNIYHEWFSKQKLILLFFHRLLFDSKMLKGQKIINVLWNFFDCSDQNDLLKNFKKRLFCSLWGEIIHDYLWLLFYLSIIFPPSLFSLEFCPLVEKHKRAYL